jgi:proliferating cell nuclear antigen
MTNVLEMQTVQSGAIRNLIDNLKDVLTDINMIFDEQGMKIMTMDGTRTSLIHVKLDADRFETYICKRKLVIGINMTSLYRLVKVVDNNDTITFFIEDQKTHELGIKLENADKNSTTVFKLRLLDLDQEEYSVPPVEFECIITMPSNTFQRLCRDMMFISDTIIIESSEVLKMTCEGDFACQETIIGEATHGMIIKTSKDIVIGKYSLKSLNLFTKSASNLCNTIELFMKTDYPLILKYNVANLGEIRYCLAPKVDE